MYRVLYAGCVGWLLIASSGCNSSHSAVVRAAPAPELTSPKTATNPATREIRANGTIQAVRAFTVQVPRIEGVTVSAQNNGRLTLVKLAQNGTRVKQGDVLAEFDRTTQLDAARDAQAKFDDLSQQVRKKAAENRSDQEKRGLDLKQAEADLGKALIEVKKGPVLADIERMQNEAKAEGARLKVEALKQIDAHRRQAEAAALRVLELQTQRQKVTLQRAQANAEKLVLRAAIAGMVALENIWRGGSMGNAQEGDQLWPGQGLLKIFDPGEMQVLAFISEPDEATLAPGTLAAVRLDAYPDAVFRARFDSASPVATSAQGSPIKNFAARFRLEQEDARLLPDLSAAVIISDVGQNRAQEK